MTDLLNALLLIPGTLFGACILVLMGVWIIDLIYGSSKMKIEIKNRYTGEVIFSHDVENNTITLTVELAIKKSANLNYANLSSADLSYADLSSADLRCANLSSANLSFAKLNSADLRYADLISADLRCADLSYANLNYAKLNSAKLKSANLNYANLSSADLRCANLSYANLSCADLSRADLRCADLSYANLSSAAYGKARFTLGFNQLLGLCWPVFFFDAHIKIGCRFHTTEEWINFSDEEIAEMESRAAKFWKENKQLIIGIAMFHQGFKVDADGKFVKGEQCSRN